MAVAPFQENSYDEMMVNFGNDLALWYFLDQAKMHYDAYTVITTMITALRRAGQGDSKAAARWSYNAGVTRYKLDGGHSNAVIEWFSEASRIDKLNYPDKWEEMMANKSLEQAKLRLQEIEKAMKAIPSMSDPLESPTDESA